MRFARRLMMLLELLVGVLAVGGGAALLWDPTGASMGYHVGMLRGIFESFMWPGAILVVMGIVHFVAAWMEHKRHMWDHAVSTAASITLVLWISVQVILIGFYSWTQVAFFFLGAIIFYCATELWGAGEGPHLGFSGGMEDLDLKNLDQVDPEWRRSDRFWVLHHLLHRRRPSGG